MWAEPENQSSVNVVMQQTTKTSTHRVEKEPMNTDTSAASAEEKRPNKTSGASIPHRTEESVKDSGTQGRRGNSKVCCLCAKVH